MLNRLGFTVPMKLSKIGTSRSTTREAMTGGGGISDDIDAALLRLMTLIRTGEAQPALVIGLPVGFVNAAESKAELAQMPMPHITNVGRKGGSNVAASVVNALAIMAVA